MTWLTYQDISDRTGLSLNVLYVRRNRGQMPEPAIDKYQPLWKEKDIEKWISENSVTKPTN